MAATKEHPRRLTLRLTDGDLAEVHRAARARGTSVQRFVLDLVHEAVSRDASTPPVLDSWEAIEALQRRMADGTASEADRHAFVAGADPELTDEDRAWLDAPIDEPIRDEWTGMDEHEYVELFGGPREESDE